jgi:hypothetical protein
MPGPNDNFCTKVNEVNTCDVFGSHSHVGKAIIITLPMGEQIQVSVLDVKGS